MQRRSRFVFGESELTTGISSRPWLPRGRSIGGSRIAASGDQASYVARRDALLDLTLRFYESQWTAIENLVHYGQLDLPIEWYPDAEDTALSFECWLDAPIAGEDIAPTRDANFARVFELAIRLRGRGLVLPWTPYFELS